MPVPLLLQRELSCLVHADIYTVSTFALYCAVFLVFAVLAHMSSMLHSVRKSKLVVVKRL